MAPSSGFPPLLVVAPLSTHKQTFVFLHGRGSSAARFGPALLETRIPIPSTAAGQTSTTTTLQEAFPHARFVFPTACPSRATIYKRSLINQWFDGWHVDEPGIQQWLAVDGLCQTVAFLHALLRNEIALVGGRSGDVVLAGLSQGCASSLVAMLLWEGEPLGAVLGMCGYLPFLSDMERVVRKSSKQLRFTDTEKDWQIKGQDYDFDPVEHSDDDFDPFERPEGHADNAECSDKGEQAGDPLAKATRNLREQLELDVELGSSVRPHPFKSTPLFMGHGTEDDKVPLTIGKRAADCLGSLGLEVSWYGYKGLGHWYSGEMLADLVLFLKQRMVDEVQDGTGDVLS